MTPATTLALAREIYPDMDCVSHNYPQGVTMCPNRADHPYNHVILRFDPLANPAQTLAVLCWLMNENPLAHWDLTTDGKQTPQSLAAAIVKAAGAVIEAKENK